MTALWRDTFHRSDPTFGVALAAALVCAALLFTRSPTSNFIFDEQEALLANPYVNGHGVGWSEAFRRDFWGLPPARSIGSYRPLPDILWRALWSIAELPWLLHWANILLHAVNASLVAGLALRVTGRRRLAWLAGAAFVVCAVLTEAVTGVVGLADVLAGLSVLLAVHACRLKLVWLGPAVFVATLVGFFSKETAFVAVGLVPWAAWVLPSALHPDKPRRAARVALGLVGTLAALVLFVELRKRLFPSALPAPASGAALASLPWHERWVELGAQWFHQPRLPHDPINNPLVKADWAHRVAGGLHVYWQGLLQVVFPWKLSADYSFAQESIPTRLVSFDSVLGGLALVLPPLGALVMAAVARRRRAAQGVPALLALGLMWVPMAFLPCSNLLVLLPTVRAERFWYIPAIGAAWLMAVGLDRLLGSGEVTRARRLVVIGFFAVQALGARVHALAYTNDLIFWRMTRWASPRSAKAQLNYAVMLGTRGRGEERLRVGRKALEIAPSWPMAHVYHADALCRLGRAAQAWPHYQRGLTMAPNDRNLVALSLQCLWDKKQIEARQAELIDLSLNYPGTWLSRIIDDVLEHGKEHGGVRAEDRPRSYNEGPRT
ncbi:MAG: tetratricopeptide repeat protein [Polyangiaceae bacterium]|nr:tetratricopeptide repeat protein [Polyangiaceae bacterium]